MKRLSIEPRPDWRERLDALEFTGWRRDNGDSYWVEDAYYSLTESEVETLYSAAQACETMVADAVAAIVQDTPALTRLGLDPRLQVLAQSSWRRGDPTLYGRFDFAWDGINPPKLLEYNADTPTALYEAAVVQWQWLTDRDPDGDQFNSIHEKLIEAWTRLAPFIAKGSGQLHLAAIMSDADDAATVAYMADVAVQAGVNARLIDIADIGLNGRRLVDRDDTPISHMFKVYPWEWLTAEDPAFAAALLETDIGILEPPWRVAAASKGLLVELWRRHRDHPNLLPAAWDESAIALPRIGKPILGREGANVVQRDTQATLSSRDGAFGDQPFVWQARASMPAQAGRTPVFGVWMVAGEPCGLGIREDEDPITGPNARFIPHRIEG